MLDALIYTSRALPELTDTELELVLIKSRVRNAARGVTGALLKRGAHIVQYLEGDPEALDATLARIAASPLHADVAVEARIPADRRVFDGWHMGFAGFQALHGRATATDELERLWPGVERAAGNAPAQRLAAYWRDMSGAQAG